MPILFLLGKITATDPDPDDDDLLYKRNLAFKNSAPSFNCALKINSQLIEDVQDIIILQTLGRQLDLFLIIIHICQTR